MGNYLNYNNIVSYKSEVPMNTSGVYLPEEIVIQILSYLSPHELLKCNLVCKDWNVIIKSRSVWCEKYKRTYKSKPPNYSWYVFYALFENKFLDVNLIKNPCGRLGMKNWNIINNLGDGFAVETVPQGSSPLSDDVIGILGTQKCFVTSYGNCVKNQTILLNQLSRRVLNELKPEIYASEWVTSRFDCASKYKMQVSLFTSNKKIPAKVYEKERQMLAGAEWEKVEIIINDYPDNVEEIHFTHQGKDLQFWAGHYGCKMTGATIKIKL